MGGPGTGHKEGGDELMFIDIGAEVSTRKLAVVQSIDTRARANVTPTEESEITGAVPLTFRGYRSNLTGYRVYGNIAAVNGERIGVGDLVTDSGSDYYGKYKISVTINGVTKNIYLNEPLRKINNFADYLDFETGKVYRCIAKHTVKASDDGTSSEWEDWRVLDNELQGNCTYIQPDGYSGQAYYPYVYNHVMIAADSNFYTGVTPAANWENRSTANFQGIDTSVWGTFNIVDNVNFPNGSGGKAYLRSLYTNGTPLIIYYVNSTATASTQQALNNPPDNMQVKYTQESVDNLPNLTVYNGTNTLSVDTAVQPSQVYIKGLIREM